MNTDSGMTLAGEAPHPGHYIREELEARGWSQRDLAYVLDVPEQSVTLILSGKRNITAEMAKALGDAFDVPADLFVNLQKAHDLARARAPDPGVARRARLQAQFPVREMIKRGWIIDAAADLLEAQMMRLFEADNLEALLSGNDIAPAHAAKKSRYDIDAPPTQLAWLFRVRQIAREMVVRPYSEKSLRDTLPHLRELLVTPEETRKVPRMLEECGVRFVLVESLPSAKIDGVCTWLDDSSPVVGMTTLQDRIDNFWFVLRHELEHVLRKHGRGSAIGTSRVDTELDKPPANGPEEERVANSAAADFCIPSKEMDSFFARKAPFFSERDLIGFAHRMQVHPGLVAGQLRKRLDRWNVFTKHLVKIRSSIASTAVVDGWGEVAPITG